MGSDAEERLARIAALSAGLAHELRNVLAAADSSLFLATRLDHDAVARAQHVKAGRAHLRTAQDLVNRALSPAVDGRLPRERVSIRSLVERAVAAAAAPGAKLAIEATPADLEVEGDPLLLERALVNLIENASEAGARNGRPAVSIRISVSREGAEAHLVIADDGPGLPADLLAQLFEPLAKGHPGGTGLGLRMVRAVAELHGGSVSASARSGGGATFSLHVPLKATPSSVFPRP